MHSITLPTQKSSFHVEHREYPASTKGASAPTPRMDHAACAFGKSLIIHGGRTNGKHVEDGNCLWIWDTEMSQWSRRVGDMQLGKSMAPRYGHHMFVDEAQKFIVLHGGHTFPNARASEDGAVLSDPKLPTETETWLYDLNSHSWTSLPGSPAPAAAAAYTDTTLYTVDRAESSLSASISYLKLLPSATEREKPGALAWKTITFPTNPLVPGPRPREGAALVPLSIGHGRQYLVYMFGCNGEHPEKEGGGEFYSDIWTLQLPSHGLTAAKAKDKIREKLPGVDSGEFTWAEAELVAMEQAVPEGKVHPGPRGSFGADACLGGKGVVLWGGVNAKGETEGDGWVLGLAYGYADSDRWE